MRKDNWKALILASYLILVAGVSCSCRSNSNNNNSKATKTPINIEEIIETPKPTEDLTIINGNVETPVITSDSDITSTPISEPVSTKSPEQVAKEVILGMWGNGEERQIKIVEAGYDYDEICGIVNNYFYNGEEVKPEFNRKFSGKFAYVNQNTNIYDKDGNVLYFVDVYQKAIVSDITDNDQRKHVIINGLGDVGEDITIDGYIDSNCLTVLPDTFIETDLSMQKVFLYSDGELILETNVITGGPDKGATPGTNVGCTNIILKEYNTELSGPTWNGAFVDVYIKFNWSGEGYHDSERWRTQEELNNINTFLTNGSHGCVNMSNEAAKLVDETLEVGDYSLVHK